MFQKDQEVTVSSMLWLRIRYGMGMVYAWLIEGSARASVWGKVLRLVTLVMVVGLGVFGVVSLSRSNTISPISPRKTTTTIYSYLNQPGNQIHAKGDCGLEIAALNTYISTHTLKTETRVQLLGGYQKLLESMLKTCPSQVSTAFINTIGIPWVGGLAHNLKPVS